ncbi:helix-turn-helix domain-containing protein [Pseudochelatococcus sp. B33]
MLQNEAMIQPHPGAEVMTDRPTTPVPASRCGDIDTLLRGSDLVGRSSIALGWKGLVVEQRRAPPTLRAEEMLNRHYILLWRGHPTITEREYKRGRFTRVVKQPGTLSVGPAGHLPAVRSPSRYDVIAGVIDPSVAGKLAQEEEVGPPQPLYEHLGVEDYALARLIDLAAREADEDGVHGQLYGESLAVAIMARFNSISRKRSIPTSAIAALPKTRLQRVLDKIESEYHRELGLEELARESGYSRAHFLRMFRAATGTTPHHHLLTTRLEKAHGQLVAGASSITEVALSCGFSSHGHLTRLFRQRYGITPSDVRRGK